MVSRWLLLQALTSCSPGCGIVLLLGFWEDQGDRWVCLGSHSVAVSDTCRDAFESGRVGLVRSPAIHPYPHAASIHSDARYVSQDAYHAADTDGPGGVLALEDYVYSYQEVSSLFDQNLTLAFGSYLGPAITTKVD